MRILADENIPCVLEAFGPLGDVTLMAGRRITRDALRGVDALVVRSVTRVDAALVEGTPVRFVGSATAGVDHVDVDALLARGIHFRHAPGSNAESVAQYIAAALLHVFEMNERVPRGASIGIVGAGHVGARVERVARALGMHPTLCDPPLARATGDAKYRPLAELRDCDVVTLHAPLLHDGPDRTAGLIDEAFLHRMKPGALVINAARGGIVDERALIERIASGALGPAVIDAWVGEPRIDADLIGCSAIATPHIAGYAADAKFRGTEMILAEFCKWAGVAAIWTAERALPRIADTVEIGASDPALAIRECVARAYPIGRDDALLRWSMNDTPQRIAITFDDYRKDYPMRREFAATRIEAKGLSPDLIRSLRGLGFTVEEATAR